jgi:Flp pilus assembly secretin CpaC
MMQQMMVKAALTMITHDNVQGAKEKLFAFVREKAADSGGYHKIVIEPNADATEVFIRFWLYTSIQEPQLTLEIKLSEVQADDIKQLANNLFDGK